MILHELSVECTGTLLLFHGTHPDDPAVSRSAQRPARITYYVRTDALRRASIIGSLRGGESDAHSAHAHRASRIDLKLHTAAAAAAAARIIYSHHTHTKHALT